MAYDNKNEYPDRKERKTPLVMSAAGSRGAPVVSKDKTLKDKAVDFILRNKDGMEELQREVATYYRYYIAEKMGNEVKGRSEVVMSDVQDTIEGVMPSLMRIFYGGRNVLDIRPVGIEDEQKAKLMEEKVNFDIQKGMNGFEFIYKFIKDSLFKIGIAKYYWIKTEKSEAMPELKGISDIELMPIASNPKFRIDEIRVDEETGLMDVKYSKIDRVSRPHADNVPLEEFIFDRNAKEIEEAVHKKRVHRNYLKRYGLTDEEIQGEVDRFFTGTSDIVQERFRDLGGYQFISENKDSPYVFIYECYMNEFDENGDPVNKIVRVFGDRQLGDIEDNAYGEPPFVVMSPVLMPYRAIGRGLAELAVEIQRLRTALVRHILDNLYYQNLGMRIVNRFRIDPNSLMDGNKPGGIAFTLQDVDPNSAIASMPITPLPNYTMNLLEYIEGPIKENRTGVTRYNQGLDSKTLNKTATGISIIHGASQQRIELMARIFAETGMRRLYTAFVKMNIDFFDMEVNLKINDKWRMVRREDIDGEYDVMIDVGSSTGTKEMAYQQKMQMLNTYGMIANVLGPMTTQIFTIENVKNMIRAMWEDMGYRNVDLYVAPEGSQPMMGGMNGNGGNQGAGGGGPEAAGGSANQGVLQPGRGPGEADLMGLLTGGASVGGY